MKINKVILRISHFFGFRKSEEHIDDVTVNVSLSRYNQNQQDDLKYNTPPIEVVDHIKKEIFRIFDSNKKLESRCRKTHQVWVTFYDNELDKKGGSLMKMLYYDDNVLYYPVVDKAAYERNQKLKEILE